MPELVDAAWRVRRIPVGLVGTTAGSVDEAAVSVRETHRLDAGRMGGLPG